mmetsp:Transcript_4860/g.14804  ORF Transcript_4860/g.14804 Transcript_4860/m.14804 type:complete len:227 (-) Transcript_4860:684-1364(-)
MPCLHAGANQLLRRRRQVQRLHSGNQRGRGCCDVRVCVCMRRARSGGARTTRTCAGLADTAVELCLADATPRQTRTWERAAAPRAALGGAMLWPSIAACLRSAPCQDVVVAAGRRAGRLPVVPAACRSALRDIRHAVGRDDGAARPGVADRRGPFLNGWFKQPGHHAQPPLGPVVSLGSPAQQLLGSSQKGSPSSFLAAVTSMCSGGGVVTIVVCGALPSMHACCS